MANLIVSIVIAILSFSFFSVTYRVNGINRILYNIPVSIFESSIPLAQEVEEPIIYFSKAILENKLTSYFSSNLERYCSDYSLSFYYYNQEDYSYCSSITCDAIEINLQAEILINCQYNRTARFYIQDNR